MPRRKPRCCNTASVESVSSKSGRDSGIRTRSASKMSAPSEISIPPIPYCINASLAARAPCGSISGLLRIIARTCLLKLSRRCQPRATSSMPAGSWEATHSRSSVTARWFAAFSKCSQACRFLNQRVSPRSKRMQRMARPSSGLLGKCPPFRLRHRGWVSGGSMLYPETHPSWCCEQLARAGFLLRECIICKAVLDRLLRVQEVVAVCILHDAFPRLAGMTRENVVDAAAQAQDFAGSDFDICRLAFRSTEGLVNQHSRVWQYKALALGTCCQQYRAHAHGHANTHRRNIGPDPLHGIVDRQASVDHTAGRVDIQVDILCRILALEE